MSGADIANIIGQVAILVTAVSGLIISLRNSRKIEQVHIATNSMHDEIVEVTARASKAEGKVEEKAEERERQTQRIKPLNQ